MFFVSAIAEAYSLFLFNCIQITAINNLKVNVTWFDYTTTVSPLNVQTSGKFIRYSYGE